MLQYTLLDGEEINVGEFSSPDLAFILFLLEAVLEKMDREILGMAICGSYAYPLKGSQRVTTEVHATPFFKVVEDILYRYETSIGTIGPNTGDNLAFEPEKLILGIMDALRARRILL